ncbi:Heptaprenyl diphosphate synthase component 2 [compost metagenome]
MSHKNIDYYYEIMSSHSESFISQFDKSWNTCLTSSIYSKYAQSSQMQVGHRLRPLLAAWGYTLFKPSNQFDDFNEILDIAVSIELLHKASIIADDLIDQDSARHGKPTFHVQYSEHEAIIFIVFLLGSSLNKLIINLKSYASTELQITSIVQLIAITICDMSTGALKELNLGRDGTTEINKIQEIINLETVSLIKNSFLLGYLCNSNSQTTIIRQIEAIGHNCGFIFQLLNDAEPFSQINKNIEYKGNLNFDYNKSRKNIVLSYLYGMLNNKERTEVKEKVIKPERLIELYKKYDVQDFINKEILGIETEIHEELNSILLLTKNESWYLGFKKFIDYVISYCKERLSN